MNLQNNEGVVALISLTNGVVAATFSNGMLKIFNVTDGSFLCEMRLVSEGKIEHAKLASHTFASTVGRTGYNKTI